MLVFSIYDLAKNTSTVLDAALTNEVIINNDDGKSYKLLPINNENKNGNKNGKSPLENIPYISADITTQEIVDLIREYRAGI